MPLDQASPPLYQSLLLPALIAIIVAASTGAASFFGSKVVTGAETQSALASQVDLIGKNVDKLGSKIDAITDKLGSLYTRTEAVSDRQETLAHFQALDRRVDDLQRRIDAIPGNGPMRR